MCRIDGERLIDQIASHAGKRVLIPTIYYYRDDEERTKRGLTKSELSTWLAEDLHCSVECANELLDVLAKKASEQLLHFRQFKLPRMGTIHIQGIMRPKIRFRPTKWLSQKRPLEANRERTLDIHFRRAEAIVKVCVKCPKGRGPQRIRTKVALAKRLAENVKTSRSLANRFLDKLALIACNQLSNVGRFRLNDIGTLDVSQK